MVTREGFLSWNDRILPQLSHTTMQHLQGFDRTPKTCKTSFDHKEPQWDTKEHMAASSYGIGSSVKWTFSDSVNYLINNIKLCNKHSLIYKHFQI